MSKQPPLLPRPTNDATLLHEPVAPRKRTISKGKNISLACEGCRKRKIKVSCPLERCPPRPRSIATTCETQYDTLWADATLTFFHYPRHARFPIRSNTSFHQSHSVDPRTLRIVRWTASYVLRVRS